MEPADSLAEADSSSLARGGGCPRGGLVAARHHKTTFYRLALQVRWLQSGETKPSRRSRAEPPPEEAGAAPRSVAGPSLDNAMLKDWQTSPISGRFRMTWKVWSSLERTSSLLCTPEGPRASR